MKKRKLIAVLLCLVLLLPVAVACNNGTGNSTDSAPPASTNQTSSEAPASDAGTQSSPASPAPTISVEPPKPPVDPQVQRDTLTIAVESDAGTLNPGYMARGLYTAIECVYEPLWDYSETRGMIPVLMDSYEEVAEDHWIVHLKQGIKFSNGNPLTADDVIFSLDYWRTTGSNAVRVQSIDADRTAKIDDYTVDMYTPGYYLFHLTAASMFLIFDSESFDETDIVTNPVGTGPYAVKEYVTNSHLFLERRDDYWGPPPEIQYLNFRVIAEPSQIVNAISTNTIDIGRVQLADYAYVSGLPGFNMSSRNTGGGVQIGFNAGRKGYFNYFDKDPEKVKEARYAVIHAIDPQVIIDICYYGIGREMRCYSPDFCIDWEPAFDDLHPTYSIGYDVELARQYAQSSGLAGQTIRLMTNGLPNMRTLAEIIQSMLSEIDVNVEILNLDVATYQTAQYDAEGDYDIRCTEGIAPNWRICDGIINSVRYSAANSAPGAFPDNEHYLEVAPLCISTYDDALRREYLIETLYTFVDNALAYAVCMSETAYAISSDIDMSTVNYNLSSGELRLQDMLWAS